MHRQLVFVHKRASCAYCGYRHTIQQATTLDAQDILNAFQQTDAFHKPQRFLLLLENITLIDDKTSVELVDFWQDALDTVHKIEPQRLIEQGYHHAALGDAIARERMQQLTQFLARCFE